MVMKPDNMKQRMSAAKTIAESLGTYREFVLPRDVHPAIEEASSKAFYAAAAWTAFQLAKTAREGGDVDGHARVFAEEVARYRDEFLGGAK